MLNRLFILLFFSTIPLHCMEPERPKKSSKEMVKRKSKSLLPLSRKSSNEKNENEKIISEHPFISAARSKNYTMLNFYLNNPYFNPNVQDEWKNTALHHSATAQDYAGLQLLLSDHRVDASIKNMGNRTARELIDDDQNIAIEMRCKIFARVRLDNITQQECLLIKPSYEQNLMKPDMLDIAIQNIKNTVQQSDNNRNLPSSACFPDYATDIFIKNKIWFILSSLSHLSFTSMEITEEQTDSSQISSPRKGCSRSKTVDSTPPNKLRFSLSSLSKTSPRPKTNSLIEAVKNCDLNAVQQHIDNPNADLNQKDQYGNTALHRIVVKLTEETSDKPALEKIIVLFLHNPRIDSSIARDSDKRTASQILSGGECPEIRKLLFARMTLDTQTNHELGKMLLKSYIDTIPLSDDLIKQTVQSIKSRIQLTENEQTEDKRDLPEEAKLPDYATDNFVFTIIKNRIPVESENISESQTTVLKNIFLQSIEAILSLKLTVDIHEKPIQELINNILKTIDESYNHLTRFTTKPCIFEVLKKYTDKQKPKNSSSILLKNNETFFQ
jgi:ankyrin repeat protein